MIKMEIVPKIIEKDAMVDVRSTPPFPITRYAIFKADDILVRRDMIGFVKNGSVFHVKLRNSDMIDAVTLKDRNKSMRMMIKNAIGADVNEKFVGLVTHIISYYSHAIVSKHTDDFERRCLKLMSISSIWRFPISENKLVGVSRVTNKEFEIVFEEPIAVDICELIYDTILCDDIVAPMCCDINHIAGVDDMYVCPLYLFIMRLMSEVIGDDKCCEFINKLREFIKEAKLDKKKKYVSRGDLFSKLREFGFESALKPYGLNKFKKL
ncbi:MAG: hypothetical protein GXO43_03825 [Crenarchaeota archaeon]|nr:hypothetical protein [Thermoproteota archaeon]